MEKGLTKQNVISILCKSPHGKLDEYIPVAKQAIEQDGAFYQHLIAWNHAKGQILDSKAALPVIALAYEKDRELLSNAYAHLAKLNPRELFKAYKFARQIKPVGQLLPLDRLVQAYLHAKELEKGWDFLAVQHSKVLKSLYAYSRATATERASAVLFGHKRVDGKRVPLAVPRGSVFEALANLKNMSPTEVAGTIVKFKLPFLIASERLGARIKDPDILVALIGRMTPTELTGNTKKLLKLGMKTNPAIRGAYDAALSKATSSTKHTLKATAAINAVTDEGTKEKLRGLQEKQIAAAGGPDGDWLVLSDKSGSMARAIAMARHISASLVTFVRGGRVWLVFFDTSPLAVDVTGLTLDQIQMATRHITANGGTSIGCGLNRMLAEKVAVDGIVIVSDGEENQPPFFGDVYKKYIAFADRDIPVYFFLCESHPGQPCFTDDMRRRGLEMQTYDVRNSDYYSLPNIVQTIRSNRYSLVDEIMAQPLLSVTDLLPTLGRAVAVA